MRIDEIKRLARIEATEIREGCWKIAASEGHALKTGGTYTDTVYMPGDADVELEVVADRERRMAENAEKYEGKTLDEAREMLLAEITAYDTSESVRQFRLNGTPYWFGRDERVAIARSVEIAKENGAAEYALWLGEEMLTTGCGEVEEFLMRLEVYAQQVYNVTARHKRDVQGLADMESVKAFDVAADYPKIIDYKI